MAWRFPILYFFSIAFSKSMCISAFGTSSSPSNSFVMLLIYSAFLLYSLSGNILVQNRSVSLASGCWYVFISSPPSCWQNFLLLFWNVLLCLYYFTLCRYLFNLPSFTTPFWFISSSCIVNFSCVAVSFLSLSVSAFFLCFIILACFRRFLPAFPVVFSNQVLIFSSCFLRRPRFSH